MKAARSTLVFAAIALSACVSSHVMLAPARPPLPPEAVKIYFQPPATAYQRIALLDTSSRYSFSLTEQGKTDAVIQRLKIEAGKLGANGVLIEGLADRPTGSVGTGLGHAEFSGGSAFSTGIGFSGTVVQKFGHGIAIYVEPAAAGPR
ncbi:MAG: hypothetical protein KGL34_05535 [Gammaproteobacteria bacterium]|nr:hypothetical protein [Gammaproteobacteria bacterium]